MNDNNKIINLFEFLKQYNNIKNPVVTNIENQKWIKWMDNIPICENIINNIYNMDEESDILFTILKPKLTECPNPPENLKEWIFNGWQNVDNEVEIKDSIDKIEDINDKNKRVTVIYFKDDDERVKSLEEWKNIREVWKRKEIISRKVDGIFNEFYMLYSLIKKESEDVELIFGDGILYCSGKNIINHPILLQPVELKFDPNIPSFDIRIADKNSELYNSVFSYLLEPNYDLLLDLYDEFNKNQYVPYENADSSSFLNRLAHALEVNGEFFEDKKEIKNITSYPQIYRRPILFLRKRNLGFQVAIDSIIEDININGSIPSFLEDIVGKSNEKQARDLGETVDYNSVNSNGIDNEILLTKSANAEQLMVAKKLEQNDAVLVQGPPGTGKTHTIANMIGHLLSEGKSILVTSYSEKALSVMKEKVDINLQALCLSLLSTTESRNEMEKTLDVINENRSRFEPATLQEKINKLQNERDININKLMELKHKLKNARLNEYRAIIVNGREYNPIEAGKFIQKHGEDACWIPLPVEKGSLSLSQEELIELYRSNINITIEEEEEYNCNLPEIDELITPIEFNNIINKKNSFNSKKLEYGIGLWKSECENEELLSNICEHVRSALNIVDFDKEWSLEIIENSKEEVLKNNWNNLIDEIERVYTQSVEFSEKRIKYNPEFIDLDESIDMNLQFDTIINKIKNGGKITKLNLFINKSMKKAIDLCRVNGDAPSKLNEFIALKECYNLNEMKNKLKDRWNRQMASLGADNTDSMGKDFEMTLKKYVPIIKNNLIWYNKIWNIVVEELKNCGLNYDQISIHNDLSSNKYSDLKFIKEDLGVAIIDALEAQIYRIQYKNIKKDKNKLEEIIMKYSKNSNSRIMSGLETAIMMENIEDYKQAYESIKEIKELGKDIEKRHELLNKLQKSAPAWANSIKERKDKFNKEQIPDNVEEAWLYSQFVKELEDRHNVSIDKLQEEISMIEEEIKRNTAELAFNKAWKFKLAQFDNNKRQVQAIEGWRQLIRKIGAGKGKRAEKLKSEARKLMPYCQGAVPVWIMPLNKVVENFNPQENKFDVVIIDEASQADIMALVALYLGKQVIIVGDNEQVSPLAIGEKTEEMDRIIQEYLRDIPNHFLYSGRFSIYDLAQASGYQPVRLKEHFRCVPAIIQYSNILSYNGQIKALRDTSNVKTKPPIITYRVEDGICNNKINEKEAEVIVSLILACLKHSEYNNKTFGVITLRGDKQAALIDKMLQSKMDVKEYSERNILCGNSSNFQGDERDIIFLTMVDSNDKEGPMRLNSYGSDNLYKKRYNVAVSRAKDQLWLIHSLDSENDLKTGDIRKELIDYCNNYKSRQTEYEKNVIKAESEFEKRVMKYLIENGYNITPQWEVGAYRIDMVATYKDNKVAIECDGERWHGEDNIDEDMERQSILERLGWRFIRIRGSKFFTDEISTMEKVYEKLTVMGIYKENINNISLCEDEKLKNAIISEAQCIRDEWKEVE